MSRPDSRGVLHGCRVLDLGIITAGASTTALLADLGAEVIKVESTSYLDPFRYWEGETHQAGWWDRSPPFRSTNRNKLGITLDLKSDTGRDLFLRLVGESDVVVENFRRGVLANLGVDYPALAAVNPTVILASISSQGDTGPMHDAVSYGSTLEAVGGLAHFTRYRGGPPVVSGRLVNYPDQVVSLFAAGAVVAAWIDRRRRGAGAHLDISQRELTSFLLGEELAASWWREAEGTSVREAHTGATGNHDATMHTQGCFRSHDGRWIVLSFASGDQTTRFLRRLPALAANRSGPEGEPDGSPGSHADGSERSDRRRPWASLEDGIAVSHSRDVVALARELGVPAVAVDDWVHGQDDASHRRGMAVVQAADGGRVKGFPFQMSPSSLAVRRPAPMLGQHTVAVLMDLLGLSAEECARLAHDGVIGTAPKGVRRRD